MYLNSNFSLATAVFRDINKAIKIFDVIQTVDSIKLANKINLAAHNQNKIQRIYIQVNIGNERQKSGISVDEVLDFYKYCKSLELDILGLMCIPPFNEESKNYFSQMNELNQKINLSELSMGMSSDFLHAIEFSSTYLRIGSNIFGKRS